MDRSFVRKLGLFVAALLLSAFLAFVMEWSMSMNTPGAIMVYYLFNPGGSGPVNAPLVIATHLTTDFLFCFAIITGLYLIVSRFSKGSAR